MIVIKGNDQLMQEEAAASMAQSELENKAKSDQAIIQSGLISLVRKRWDQALKAKRAIEQQMMKNIRQAMGVYEPEKLAAIKKMGGADVFIGITGTKCRHVLAWLDDILDQPGTKPWALEPTPVEELPADLTEEVNSRYVRGMMLSAMEEQNQTGAPMDMDKITSIIQSRLPTVQADVMQLVRDKAKEKSDEMSRALDDQLVEGGWYQALMGCLFDLVIVKNGFIKGPITVMKIVRATDPDGKIIVKREAKKTWARANPFDIYPEPDSSGVQDGYLFHHVGYRRKDLIAMIGIDGYNELEIRAVLAEHANHGLRDWTGIESQRATLENKDTSAVYDSEIIDGLELYSSISGHTLLGYGLSPEQIPDPDMDYDTIVYLIGNHIIKATLNEDPYGHKPFSTAGYDDQPDSFWKKPLPEKIVDIQSICNATARGLVNNIGMGSGPQVEINIDRLSPAMKGDVNIVPWKKWLTTNKMMQSGKAIEFWQANMHAQELMDVFTRFSRVADEQSIPAFSHGDTNVGGAGNTASGLSMLITQAARGIKSVVKNIDRGLIEDSIMSTYDEMAIDPKYRDKVGDLNLKATGSSALIEKEQRAVRMLEFLAATNNPADQQLTGAEGRGYLLAETARAHGIDPDKALPGLKKMKTSAGMAPEMNKIQADAAAAENAGIPPGEGAPTPGGSPPNSQNLDQAGNPVQGTANQLFNEGGGHPPVV